MFSHHVDRLCQILWPPKRSIRHQILQSKAATQLCKNQVFGSFTPAPQLPLIERLAGGDHNRITAILLPSSYSVNNHRLNIRLPREEKTRPDREVAPSASVRRMTSIPGAQTPIAVKDFGRDNPQRNNTYYSAVFPEQISAWHGMI